MIVKISKKGFTLIEVVLFLALSGALVAFVIAGTSRNIAQKRYYDTVENFVDYLQGLYSDVNYVQGNGTSGGNSNQAIYGKLIIQSPDGKEFKEYTVLGDANCSTPLTDALETLNVCHPSVGTESESYKPTWGGSAQFNDTSAGKSTPKSVAILIITHPSTGMKYTYSFSTDTTAILPSGSSNNSALLNTASKTTFNSSFSADINVDFCLSSDDEYAAGYSSKSHKLIRINKNSNNASGVEIISDDNREGLCQT